MDRPKSPYRSISPLLAVCTRAVFAQFQVGRFLGHPRTAWCSSSPLSLSWMCFLLIRRQQNANRIFMRTISLCAQRLAQGLMQLPYLCARLDHWRQINGARLPKINPTTNVAGAGAWGGQNQDERSPGGAITVGLSFLGYVTSSNQQLVALALARPR